MVVATFGVHVFARRSLRLIRIFNFDLVNLVLHVGHAFVDGRLDVLGLVALPCLRFHEMI